MSSLDEPALDAKPVTPPRKGALARYAPVVARVLLGLIFFVFGLNGFLNFIPPPSSPPPEAAMAFAGALMKTGYMFPFIKGTEVVCGGLLLANRFTALALTILAPIILNILAFHTILAPAGAGLAIVIVLLEIYLAWSHRHVFRPMLAARVTS